MIAAKLITVVISIIVLGLLIKGVPKKIFRNFQFNQPSTTQNTRNNTTPVIYSKEDLLAMCPKYSYTTDKIELVEQKDVQGYHLEFYRNKAYTCSRTGYHTFVIAYPKNFSSTDKKPLWIRMHGGAAGAYAPNGNYLPSKYCSGPNQPCWIDEESFNGLSSYLQESGLVANVESQGNFRFLVPSMCDHDVYSGIGDHPEQYNPNIDANGQKPRADGMLALRSALDYATHRYHTDHVFAHGTSAGSVGAGSLATALSCENKNISGAILDSGITTKINMPLVEADCGELSAYEVSLIIAKVAGGENKGFVPFYMEDEIRSGFLKTPIFNFWSSRDKQYACKGKDFITIKNPENGQTVSGSGSQVKYTLVDEAIDQVGKNTGSTYREICADPAKNANTCSMHVATTRSKQKTGGDLSRGGEDYNQIIMEWVNQRLIDPSPHL